MLKEHKLSSTYFFKMQAQKNKFFLKELFIPFCLKINIALISGDWNFTSYDAVDEVFETSARGCTVGKDIITKLILNVNEKKRPY